MAESERHIEVSAFEPKDIGEGFIWGVVGTCGAVLLVCSLAVVWLYPQAMTARTLSSPLPLYPPPRLQVDPASDLRRFRAQQLEELNSSGWIDQSRGIAHIPIGTAMQQVVTAGIADWPSP